MTMKVTEHTLTVKRKKHPNDGRYPCRASQEILSAGMKLLSSLSKKEMELLQKNDLILEEDETAELYDEIKVGDIIGLGLIRPNGFVSNKYEVIKIIENEDYMICKNLGTEKEEDISFQDVSVGFAMGFAEILYRDGKPFGISEDIEVKLIFKGEPKEEEGDTPPSSENSPSDKSDANKDSIPEKSDE